MPGVRICRQDNRLGVRIFRINQNQRHAGAVETVQFRRDVVGEMRVIAEQRDGVDVPSVSRGRTEFRWRFFVHLAGQAPVGGEIHQHRLAGGARLRDGFGLHGCQSMPSGDSFSEPVAIGSDIGSRQCNWFSSAKA